MDVPSAMYACGWNAASEAVLAICDQWFNMPEFHESWCEAKGRCSNCDPLNEIREALTGEPYPYRGRDGD